MRKVILVFIIILLLGVITACGDGSDSAEAVDQNSSQPEITQAVPEEKVSTAVPQPTAETSEDPIIVNEGIAYEGLGENVLADYYSRFEIHMNAEYEWSYNLETKANADETEYALQMDGLEKRYDMGDVRLVEYGVYSRMTGEATDGECVQFSNDFDLGPVFLTPDDILNPTDVIDDLVVVGEEFIGEFNTVHYSLQGDLSEQWREAELDLWVDSDSGVTVQWQFNATGEDTLFNAGEGEIFANYAILDVLPQYIQPIKGCEVDLPLPEEYSQLIIFPGLISFEASNNKAEMSQFYIQSLEADGWLALDLPHESDDAIVLSYRKGGEGVEVNMEEISEGVRVELLLLD